MPVSTRLRATLAAALAVAFLAPSATPARADQSSVGVPVVHLDGRGHGHGVGMSQWGAYTMAMQGASSQAIIGAFYPGTQLTTAGGEVVVGVDRRDVVRIQLPGGGEIRSARAGQQQPGFPVSVAPGGVVDIVREADGFHVRGGSVAALSATGSSGTEPVPYSAAQDDCILGVCPPDDGTAPPDDSPPEEPPPATTPTPPGGGGSPAPAPPPPSPPPPQGEPEPSEPVSPTPVWAVPADGSVVRSVDRGRSYRGLFEATGAPGEVHLRNHVDIEAYLKGMAEVPGSWPPAAVQAQAIAARTYALRAMSAGGQLCDSESCQVYVGTAHESAGQAAAVDATRGMVVSYGGRLASTFYSASGGGFAANVAEGFGTPYDVPYLQARQYPTVHPDEWAVDIALTDVARRLGYPGTVTAVRIDETGPSGRPLRMTLDGDAGPADVDPQEFRRRLGLRSTLFTVATTEVDEAPPPPPEDADPGVVGIAPDAEVTATAGPSNSFAIARDTEVAASVLSSPRSAGFWLSALALALLVVAWTGATLGAIELPLGGARLPRIAFRSRGFLAATMARWTNRSR